jgi:AcrR family transcriptional regulator
MKAVERMSRSEMEFCGHGCRACASLRRAALKLAGEQGMDEVTIAAIADRAQVLVPLTVRHIGDDAMACLCAAYLESMTDLQDRFATTMSFALSWDDGLDTAVREMLATLAADPARARFLFAEALAGPPALDVLRDRLRERSVRLLAARHRRLGEDPELSRRHCEQLEETMANALARACRRGNIEHLPAIAPEIIGATRADLVLV